MSTAVEAWMVETKLAVMGKLGALAAATKGELVTVAVFVERLAALKVVAVTLMVMTAVLPTAKLPRLQVTVVVPEQVPMVVEKELGIKVTSAGSGSVRTTF